MIPMSRLRGSQGKCLHEVMSFECDQKIGFRKIWIPNPDVSTNAVKFAVLEDFLRNSPICVSNPDSGFIELVDVGPII